jgi:hypothetical protein
LIQVIDFTGRTGRAPEPDRTAFVNECGLAKATLAARRAGSWTGAASFSCGRGLHGRYHLHRRRQDEGEELRSCRRAREGESADGECAAERGAAKAEYSG